MKAELVSEQEIVNPQYNRKAAVKAAHAKESYPHKPYLKAAPGTIIDDPESYMLVKMGVAIPADDECRERAGMTQAQMEAAIHAQKRVAAGIHPDDFERYDAGEIAGYNADGTDIPGPNVPKPSEEETVLAYLLGEDDEDE